MKYSLSTIKVDYNKNAFGYLSERMQRQNSYSSTSNDGSAIAIFIVMFIVIIVLS